MVLQVNSRHLLLTNAPSKSQQRCLLGVLVSPVGYKRSLTAPGLAALSLSFTILCTNK